MAFQVFESNLARSQWRAVQDLVFSGQADVVVRRHGTPTVAVIPYGDFLAIRDELEQLRIARRVDELHRRWKEDPSQGRPYKDFRAELVAKGLLDE